MMLEIEQQAYKEGFRFVIGIDEAGRGPLAGPVVASAVLLKSHSFVNTINDSKKLSPRQREKAFLEIEEKAWIGIGVISEMIIDSHNILNAAHMAMNNAVLDLLARMSFDDRALLQQKKGLCLLVDGNLFRSQLPYAFKTIPQGDQKSLSIACASIMAKVTRDRMLSVYDKIFPVYGFGQHRGYPTAQHKEAIKRHGLSVIHRKTFNYL